MAINLKDLMNTEVEVSIEETASIIGGNIPDACSEATGYIRRTGCDGHDPIGSDQTLIETDRT